MNFIKFSKLTQNLVTADHEHHFTRTRVNRRRHSIKQYDVTGFGTAFPYSRVRAFNSY